MSGGEETGGAGAGAGGPGAAGFEPSIVAFTCAWCGYPSAVLAGVNRIEYPPGVMIIRVMCSGMVEPAYIMKAFEYGADGVIIVGCQMDNCHYMVGNKRAEERAAMMRELLDLLGIGSARLRTEWINASQRVEFARAMNEFSARLRELGPGPVSPGCRDGGVEDSMVERPGRDGALGERYLNE
ncbi:MAG: hydrogenase iron-sulfur subunit [Thermoplasmata archaeon]